jgi:hypothetical protein
VRGNRHIELPAKTPAANLMLALAQKFDVPQDTFGVSTGAVGL